MRKYLLIFPLLLFILAGPATVHAQDGFFSNAQTLERGTFAIGLQPVFLTAQDDFMFIGRASYGLARGLTSHFKVGFQDNTTYVGAHLESNVISEPDNNISFSLIGGVFSYDDFGLKLGASLSKDFNPVSLYTGINYQPLFVSGNTINSWLIPIGLDFHASPGTLDLMVEGDIPLNDESEYLEAITFGARIYLN